MTTVGGLSPVTGEEEVGTVVITTLARSRPDDTLFYVIAVAPRSEYSSYESTFANVLKSIQF